MNKIKLFESFSRNFRKISYGQKRKIEQALHLDDFKTSDLNKLSWFLKINDFVMDKSAMVEDYIINNNGEEVHLQYGLTSWHDVLFKISVVDSDVVQEVKIEKREDQYFIVQVGKIKPEFYECDAVEGLKDCLQMLIYGE